MSLFPHQEEAVAFVLRRFEAGFGAALCYEMGLGKTFIGLGVARHFSNTVVFLPAYLREAWTDAAEILGVPPPTFVSYDARAYPTVAADALVILDESQYIKNRESARWRRLVPAVKRATARLLLTGTPMLNRHCELWTQLRLMGYDASWTAFTRRFCGGRERYIRRMRRSIWDVSKSTRSTELRSLLGEHGFQFRDKSILGDLPEKTSRVEDFEMETGPHTDNSLRDYQLSAERRVRSESWAETLRRLVDAVVHPAGSPEVYTSDVLTVRPFPTVYTSDVPLGARSGARRTTVNSVLGSNGALLRRSEGPFPTERSGAGWGTVGSSCSRGTSSSSMRCGSCFQRPRASTDDTETRSPSRACCCARSVPPPLVSR